MSDGQEGFGTRGGNGHPYKSKPGSQNPLAFHFGGLQNLLKLRTTFKFNERLSGLVGADVNVQQQTAFPVALLQYQIIGKGRHWGVLQASTTGLTIKKPFKFQKKDFSCKITPKAGYTFQGRKELGLDVNSVKPWQAVLIGAVGIVALGRPVTGSKRYPDFTLTLPGMRGKKGLAQGEANVTVQRSRNGLSVSLNQFNGVLNL
ncbi:hypothetical protein ABBQ38_013989 [Trebouxia sp. C0009 RCD-2024]